MTDQEMDQIENLPKGGPLDVYRNKASFNWKKMKLFFEDLDLIKYKVKFSFVFVKISHNSNKIIQLNIWEKLRSDPIFSRPNEEVTISKKKDIAYQRLVSY